MKSSSSIDKGDERQWKICDKRTGGAFAWEQEWKVLNCSTQEGTANPPSRNPYAAAWITWCNFGNTLCWLSQQPHVQSWNLEVSWKVCIQANATVSSELGGNVFSRFRFQVGWLEPDAFFRHILLDISTTSCLILKFESVLKSLQLGKCDCLLRIWWRRFHAILISSWMTGTRCIFSDTFCWLSQQPHACSWNLKVSWKVCIQANATVSSEFGGDVFSRFRFQVGWLEPDAFFPTHFVGYLKQTLYFYRVGSLHRCITVGIQQFVYFPRRILLIQEL